MFRMKRDDIASLPKTLRRQLAPGPGHIEPGLPSRTKLVKVRIDRACLWSACKSTSLAILLIVIGASMAVVGYYAPTLSSRDITIANQTVTLMNPSAHWHLKNLTYVGPAFMGLGCVIIVAICVMTFEARDKAAKICPEDPPKHVKDELYVNVIKNIVRKYSGVPKVAPHVEETNENASLLSPSSIRHGKRSIHLLEKPVDHLLSCRSSSEPCFGKSFPIGEMSTQLPLVQITSSDSPLPDVVRAIAFSPSQPEAFALASVDVDTTFSPAAPLRSASPLTCTLPITTENLPTTVIPASKTTPGITARRKSISGETVADVHPLPSSCSSSFPPDESASPPPPVLEMDV